MNQPSRKKKIICTVSNDLVYDQRMIRTCQSLLNAGYEVVLVGRKKKGSVPLDDQPYHQKRFWLPAQSGKEFYIFLNIRLFLYLLFNSFDIVCAVDLDTVVPAVLAAKLKRKKVVLDAHEYFPEVPELVKRDFERSIWEQVEEWSVKKVDRVYTVTESIAQIYRENYGIDSPVIRNVPNLVPWSIPSKPKKYLIYQGALNEGRGIEAMLLAMSNFEFKLFLAGEGDLSELLRDMVHQLKLKDKVIFTGYQKPDELNELTRHAFIGINLLENKGKSYYYSLSNKFFSYIHAGIPQVSINFPEYKKLNKQYNVALLIDDLKPETIIQAVNQLLNNEALYISLQQNCMRAREELNWDHESQKLTEIYNRL